MRKTLLVVCCGLLGLGCAAIRPDSGTNNNSPAGSCQTEADCSSGQVCCQTPGSPVVDGEPITVCSAQESCCDCFTAGSCDRCDVNTEECVVVSQGVGECQPLACVYPTCTSDEDCQMGELCCSASTAICDGCLGTCQAPSADECGAGGHQCGGGPYAAADPAGAHRAGWLRHHRIIPLLADRGGEATVSATFRWQHDAGRPPPHDFAIGVGESRIPVFQVFGRSGRSFARFGLQLVPLERDQLYRISLSIEPEGSATRARARLVRVADRRSVLTASTRLSTRAHTVWREQLSPSGPTLDARLDLREFWIQPGGRSGRSVAHRTDTIRPGACGTSI